MQVLKGKKILVAALDWGLGHATRCVPIIRRLQNQGYEVILASGGTAKKFFENYFPELLVLDKPSYNISYPKDKSMVSAMLRKTPAIIRTIISEHFWLKKIISEHKISEVISDNCYGLWNKKIHSIFITHQLQIKCPKKLHFLEFFLHKIVLFFVRKYDECYIPDLAGIINYSGELSHQNPLPSNARFIGLLSRFSDNKSELESTSYDIVFLLSGPEPQRTILENKFVKLLRGQNKKCCIIRGIPGNSAQRENTDEFIWYNHLPDDELKSILLNSKKIICRSGYSTIMDLVELGVKAMLIPTPGQTEQEYLAKYNCSKHNEQFEMIRQENIALKDLIREVNRPSIRRLNKLYGLFIINSAVVTTLLL